MDYFIDKHNFSSFNLSNVELNKEGRLRNINKSTTGVVSTDWIEVENFTEVTAGWNCKTVTGSYIELLVSVKVGKKESEFFSYGKWCSNGENIGVENYNTDNVAKSTCDRIFVLNNMTANAVRLKAYIYNEAELDCIYFSTRDEIDEEVVGRDWLKIIDVPQISQKLSGHQESNRICSPTSVTMLLSFYGVNPVYFDVCKGALDSGNNAYGNWPQNMANASEYGLRAYAKSCASINAVKNFISKGIPVAASVVMSDKSMLDGAESAYTYGHLMVIVGFERVDGVEYIVVNDPATLDKDRIRRRYKLDQFVKVWRNYIYVILPQQQGMQGGIFLK